MEQEEDVHKRLYNGELTFLSCPVWTSRKRIMCVNRSYAAKDNPIERIDDEVRPDLTYSKRGV